MIKYILLLSGIILMNTISYSQTDTTKFQELNGIFYSDDCNSSFSISCSSYFLKKNGKYKSWFISDVSGNSYNGTYNIDIENKNIIFYSAKNDTTTYKLVLNDNKWGFDRYKHVKHKGLSFKRTYIKYRHYNPHTQKN